MANLDVAALGNDGGVTLSPSRSSTQVILGGLGHIVVTRRDVGVTPVALVTVGAGR